jgi:hypothetical protein
VEGPALRAWSHGARIHERGEQVREGEAEAVGPLQRREVSRRAERPVHRPDGEVPQVPLGGLRPDLPGPLPLPGRLPLGVHRVDLGPEARDGIGDAGLPELMLVAYGPHGPVDRVVPLRVPVALVDLEIEPLLVPRPLQEVGHRRPPVKQKHHSTIYKLCQKDSCRASGKA